MLDFYTIEKTYSKKDGGYTLVPEFIVGGKSTDLMIKGHSFYAVWDEQSGLWSTDEGDIQRFVDSDLFEEAEQLRSDFPVNVKTMKHFSTNKWIEWKNYCKSIPDNYRPLDNIILFSNNEIKKEDFATKRLPYPILAQNTPAYDTLMNTIYAPEERKKLEWAVGSIIAGDSKEIQKFIVLYGPPGSGKSTFLNIIQGMFQGYYSLFKAKDLTSNKDFALESMRSNPLFCVEHDGDLSRIEDNTLLNSIVSHEEIEVNEKYKSKYTMRFRSFLFMGTNKPVKITDSKSGIIRRLIDVSPTGKAVSKSEYNKLMKQIKFEYSGIAQHCLDVFTELGPSYYDSYIPLAMIGETNDIFNFIEDNFSLFSNEPEDGLTLSVLWKRYKEYCEDARVSYPLPRRVFKAEMKTYFNAFEERVGHQYSVYKGFKKEKFQDEPTVSTNEDEQNGSWLKFDQTASLLDEFCKDCLAQEANDRGTPLKRWDDVTTKLSEIDTKKLHYVLVPEEQNMIFIDFDLKNENGEKDYEKNVSAASTWPPTYAELSKSGSGIHLCYIYDGDPKDLSRLFAPDIEIKIFVGKSAMRRIVSRCNNIPVAHISGGLPLKEKRGKMIKEEIIKSEKVLRDLIRRNLNKEIHPGTKPSIDFIYKILDDAYKQGLKYDVSDLRQAIATFALNSTHQADYCFKMVNNMKFKSDESSDNTESRKEDEPIVFFDCEVFPNLFVIVLKVHKNNTRITLINPKPHEVEDLFKFKLIGYCNRQYDNHILYAASMGYTPMELYRLSQRIISGDTTAFFGEAYNLSYSDVYDFLSAANKMSLKKWEIKLHIHHQECPYKWDEPVPEEGWKTVAEYCGYDVDATEAVFEKNQGDWAARLILADWAHMTPNDTTNSLTTRLIIGNDPDPWSKYIYTDLSTIYPGYEYNAAGIDPSRYAKDTKIIQGKSIYKEKDPGEGGYAIGYPGIYYDVAVLDVASMHPHSAIRLKIFGEEYTARFEDIVEARVCIKNKDYEGAKRRLPEHVWHYLDDKKKAKSLSQALKTAIVSVYGLTSASFKHKLKDPRNKDNIVAKYGALFMINLEEEVKKRGYTVVHIKTDSIKIANADDYIIQFCMDYAKEYGFTFEHEDTYERMCIVNDAVFIGKYKEPHIDEETGKEIWWSATGTQFQIPYVLKTLFSKEPLTFYDLCQTMSVRTCMYLDLNEPREEIQGEYHNYHFVGKVGEFCPVKEGVGGGILLRELSKDQQESTGKRFAAVTGTKKQNTKDEAYRWMESETVKLLGLEGSIDRSYFDYLVDQAVDTIRQYGDFDLFVGGGRSEDWMRIPNVPDGIEEIPFEMVMNPPKNA